MYRAETVEQREDGGWRNEDAVVQQLQRLVCTAQTDNLVPGHASTCTPHPKLVCDSICHIEQMQLRVKQVCQAAVVLLRAAHNSRCSIHDPLQLVGNRLWCSGQQQIAIVNPGRNKSVNQYGCRFVVDRRRVIGELVEAVVAMKDAELTTDTWRSMLRSAEIITASNRTWSQAGTVSAPSCIDGP